MRDHLNKLTLEAKGLLKNLKDLVHGQIMTQIHRFRLWCYTDYLVKKHRLRLWLCTNLWSPVRNYGDKLFKNNPTLVIDHKFAKLWLGKAKQNKKLNKIISKHKRDVTQHFKTDAHDLDFNFIKSDIIHDYLGVDADMYIIKKLTYRNNLKVIYRGDKTMLVKR